MKICIPTRLRAALLAALSLSSYTLSSAHAAGVAESKTELATPSLGLDAGYTLTEVSSPSKNGEPFITKFVYDLTTGVYTPVYYQVNLQGLGDDDGYRAVDYKWVEEEGLYSFLPSTESTTGEESTALYPISSHPGENRRRTQFQSTGTHYYSFVGLSSETGGAISIQVTPTESNRTYLDGGIDGDFINNHATRGNGGAINIHGPTTGYCNIGTIRGSFVGNTATSDGGAIYLSQSVESLTIEGDFIRNRAFFGGALRMHGTVKGDLIQNHATSSGGAAFGTTDELLAITGDLYFNTADTRGGAIYGSYRDRFNIMGDIIGNRAGKSGGAIFLSSNSTLSLIALDRNISVTGNFVADSYQSSTRDFSAISLAGASLHLNAYEGNQLIINDGIEGLEPPTSEYETSLHINSGLQGAAGGSVAHEKIAAGDKDFSTVEINSTITDIPDIIVYDGTLKLGEFSGTTLLAPDGSSKIAVEATHAMLVNSKLTINSGARLETNASYLGEAANTNSITSAGTIQFTGGTLNTAISGSGRLEIAGAITSNVDLTGSNLVFNFAEASDTHSLALSDTGKLLYSAEGSLRVILAEGVSSASSIITWENDTSVMSQLELESQLKLYVGGKREAWGMITKSGNSYGVSLLDFSTIKPQADFEYADSPGEVGLTGLAVPVVSYDAASGTTSPKTQYLVVDGALGDDFNATAAAGAIEVMRKYKWETVEGKLTLTQVSRGEAGDFYAYSSDNVRVELVDENQSKINITHSFLDLTESVNGAISSHNSTIGSIKGDFVNNQTVLNFNSVSGAIYSYGSTIDNIEARFLNNLATYGGAITNDEASTIGNIKGDFVNNQAVTVTGVGGSGGAIFNTKSIINNIEACFVNNQAGSFGGAIYNNHNSKIGNITGDFVNNQANYDGGAIYNSEATISFLAKTKSMHFTGNYVTYTKEYNAIYNEGYYGESTLNFNAYDGNYIVVNDTIDGIDDYRHNQIIHINAGAKIMDDAGQEVDVTGTFSSVLFNNAVRNQSITVHNGTLVLGAFTGGADIPQAQALLENVVLTVNASGSLVTNADYLGAAGNKNSITNAGTIQFTGGTLNTAISGSGSLEIAGKVSSNVDLTGSNLVFNFVGASVAPSLALSATGTLLYSAEGSLQVKLAEGISSQDGIITWVNDASVMTKAQLESQLELYVGGKREAWSMITKSGNSYGVSILDFSTITPKADFEYANSPGEAGLTGLSVPVVSYEAGTGAISTETKYLVVNGALGDDFNATAPESAVEVARKYKWVEVAGKLTLERVALDEAGDFYAYSSNNVRIATDLNGANITQSFLDLSGQTGGAINNFTTIGNIKGDFVNNQADSAGGAILNYNNIGDIEGVFVNNKANHGGAIYNADSSTIGNITGDFVNNQAGLHGGAIYNDGSSSIGNITGDFVNNQATYDGGAINNADSTISFLAKAKSMHFTGNYVSAGKGEYNAIFNDGADGDSTINFNAYNGHHIIVNDTIDGEADYRSAQIININAGAKEIDDAGDEVDITGTFSSVLFNNAVRHQSITVHNGALVLGEFAGMGKDGEADYIPAAQAALANSSVTIKAGATVGVQGQLKLDSTSSFHTSTEGVVGGVSTLMGLAADSSISGGSINIAENSHSIIEYITLTELSINTGANVSLTLQGVTMGTDVSSTGAVALSDSTLQLHSDAEPTLSNTRSINAAEYSYYTLTSNLLMSEVSGSLTLNITLDNTRLIGVEGCMYGILLKNADGISLIDITKMSSFSIFLNEENYSSYVQGVSEHDGGIFILIPEPSTATLSLLALAALLARRRRKAA